MTYSILIVHCYACDVDRAWYPGVKRQLEAAGHQVLLPQMPGGAKPKYDEWMPILKEQVTAAEHPIVLVGHSIGSRAVLLLLNESNVVADLVLLIGAVGNDDNKQRKGGPLGSFFQHVLNPNNTADQIKKGVCLHSKDDERVDIDTQGRALAQQFGFSMEEVDGYNHFLDSSGVDIIVDTIKTNLQNIS